MSAAHDPLNPTPDPGCLHCLLAPIIERFAVEKSLSPQQVIGALTQTLGEFIATMAPSGNVFDMALAAGVNVVKEASKAAADFAAKGLREGAS